jgi:hypothetical protein
MVADAIDVVRPGAREMTTILLINPNTSERSLHMMLEIAAPHLPACLSCRPRLP